MMNESNNLDVRLEQKLIKRLKAKPKNMRNNVRCTQVTEWQVVWDGHSSEKYLEEQERVKR